MIWISVLNKNPAISSRTKRLKNYAHVFNWTWSELGVLCVLMVFLCPSVQQQDQLF